MLQGFLLILQAKIELTTGWDLGKGPCGPTCSEESVGKTISSSALTGATTVKKTINGNEVPIQTTIIGHVSGVSESEDWEQETATFKVELNQVDEKIR